MQAVGPATVVQSFVHEGQRGYQSPEALHLLCWPSAISVSKSLLFRFVRRAFITDLHDDAVAKNLECEARSDGVDVVGPSREGLLKMPCPCTGDGHDSDKKQRITLFMPVVERVDADVSSWPPWPLPRCKWSWTDGACGNPAWSLAPSLSPSIASGGSFGTARAYEWRTTCLLVPAAV